ncbi:MAG TPA: hypothetical protein VLT59_12400, partial [Steroidobacteraceae bacterium]|nr:hypothetical protein [Steroidobacteraceae bacterium]
MITLEDLLPAVALALLAGLQGARAGRAALFALPAAWFIAGCAAMVRPVDVPGPGFAAALLVGIGTLVALDRRVRDWTVTTLAILLGGAGGYLSASSIAVEADLSGVALLGATTALFTIVALLAAAAV